jgi:uncharacterized protein (DUF427 family)
MRVWFGGNWIADAEDVILLFEPGRYPMAYFKESEVSPGTLERSGHTTQHPDLGPTAWYTVHARDKTAPRGAWQHTALPAYAQELLGRVAFAWPAMDAFFEEDERIMAHAADSYHRIDIRQSSRHLVVWHRDRTLADTRRPLALYESGFAPRWYVPRADIDVSALSPVDHRTFLPVQRAVQLLRHWRGAPRGMVISGSLPDIVMVHLDGIQLHLAAGLTVIPHGPDRNFDVPVLTETRR